MGAMGSRGLMGMKRGSSLWGTALGAVLMALALAGGHGPSWADAARPARGTLELPAEAVALVSEAGQARLMESRARASYWPLAAYFETQRNQAYCSVASSVMALNALGLPRPPTRLYPDYGFFTQEDFFNSVDQSIADPAKVAREGMTLQQLSDVLSSKGIRVQMLPASGLSLEQFRSTVRRATSESGRFALLNFDRAGVHELGSGHWSPLAAYHEASDSALLLDVARYKYPPAWIPLDELHRAARSVDSTSGRSRGLLIVQR